jgi:hypothetical protein
LARVQPYRCWAQRAGARWPQTAAGAPRPPARPELREPVVLSSKDGVLEVRLTARQGEVNLDTVAKPVKNFLLLDHQLMRGAASDGRKEGRNLYPAPTLQVFPASGWSSISRTG